MGVDIGLGTAAGVEIGMGMRLLWQGGCYTTSGATRRHGIVEVPKARA
jgi:hypothetical protein